MLRRGFKPRSLPRKATRFRTDEPGSWLDSRSRFRRFREADTENGTRLVFSSLVPEDCDSVIKVSEDHSKYIPPFRGVPSVFSGCRCIRRWVEVLAGIVVVGVAVPATLPRLARLVLFGVMDTEVISLKLADAKGGTRDSTGEVAEIVVGYNSVRRMWRT